MKTRLIAALLLIFSTLAVQAAQKSPREQLLNRLKKNQAKGYMYGHQDDPFYGATWSYEEGRSDTKDAVGDYPGIMGFDLGGLELADKKNLDSVPFDLMQKEIIRQHERGGVITLSWHPRNPYIGTTAWIENDLKLYDKYLQIANEVGVAWHMEPASVPNPKHTVKAILPGGEKHDVMMLWLARLKDFMLGLKDSKGQPIPFIFRPWHEYNGAWFWWGEGNCSAEEYKALWNMTQDYLNAELPGQIVWANTPNLRTENTLEHFLERWPGDERVDILGPDAYQWTADESQAERFRNNVQRELTFIAQYAAEHGLMIALTECGCKNDVYEHWWTEVLQPAVAGFPILYALTWRNDPKEHFGALPGSLSTEDFLKFYQDKRTLFVRNLRK